jgi:hypothetical protein
MDHHEIYCPIAADPIYKPSSEFESDGRQEVFLVWQGETFANQTEEEIARAAEAEIAWATQLADESDKAAWKTHNFPWDRCDGSRELDEEAWDAG